MGYRFREWMPRGQVELRLKLKKEMIFGSLKEHGTAGA
jgi:hypothetical protein